jgi:hypothetical protein
MKRQARSALGVYTAAALLVLNIKSRRKLGDDVDIDHSRLGLCNMEVHAASVINLRGIHTEGAGFMIAF